MTIRLSAKRAIGAIYGLRGRRLPRRIVLLYHSIGSGSPFALEQCQFYAQMRWLASTAQIVSLAEIIDGASSAPLQVALTFDDGYASLHEVALPVLSEMGAVAAVFLNTGWVGTQLRKLSDADAGFYPQEQFLLWREVKDLVNAGWSIGSHGVDHLDLTAQPDGVVREQLAASRARIEEMLGQRTPFFSYTWGRHMAHLRRLVAETGYRCALAGTHEAIAAATDPLAIPRINIARDYSAEDFAAIVRGDWDYLGWIQRMRSP